MVTSLSLQEFGDITNQSDWAVWYTTSTEARGKTSADFDYGEITGTAHTSGGVTWKAGSINWITGVVTVPDNEVLTGIIFTGTLNGGETLKAIIKCNAKETTNPLKSNDILVNSISRDGEEPEISRLYVVSRALEGCIWIDDNEDGVRQSSEAMLPGLSATLYRLKEGGDAGQKDDYAVVTDKNCTIVSVEIGKQKDAVTGQVTAYAEGRYQFTNFPAGTYAVKLADGTTEKISDYFASPGNEGTNDAADSDAAPISSGTALEGTVILGIVMEPASNTMVGINQVSRNNDSGLYQCSLTVSKTVSQGSTTKSFPFTVHLEKDSVNLTGTYDCTGSAITGVTTPANGSVTLDGNGNATVSLTHGQSITITGIPAGARYTVTESAPGTGWTITTPATGNTLAGTLNADARASFVNNYAPVAAPPYAVATPAKTLTVTQGNTLPTGYSEVFTATITAITGGAPMPATATDVVTDAFTATGTMNFASFGSIQFNAAGTYEYTIKESIPATVVPGMVYDKSEYKLSVLVEDNEGQLEATPTYTNVKDAAGDDIDSPATVTGITFINTYSPAPVTLASGAIVVQKTLSGDELPDAEAFTFTLAHTPTAAGPATGLSIAMPTSISTAAIAQGTEVHTTSNFGAITFNSVGTYTFTVAETDSGTANMTYAASQNVYVKVTDDTGMLTTSFVDAAGNPLQNGGELTFTNTYTRTRPMGRLVVSKTVEGGGNANTLFTFRFAFSENMRYDYVKSDTTTGTIANGESIQLKRDESVTIYIHQGVEYAVVEDAVRDYRPMPADRTFLGTIGEEESRANYVNHYTPPAGSKDYFGDVYRDSTGNLVIRKTVIGDLGDRSKKFSFTVTFDSSSSYSYIGAESGILFSGDTVRLAHGESITILNLPAGTSYSVKESDNTDYVVTASGSTGVISENRNSTAAFTNSRSTVPNTGVDGSVQNGTWLMLTSIAGAAGLTCVDWFTRRRHCKTK